MSATTTFESGIAGRYATAIFELATETKALDRVEADLGLLDASLGESADLRAMIASPIHPRAEQGAAMAALARKMDLGGIVTNALALLAAKRRLFVLPKVIGAVRALAAAARGEVTAEVTAARPLTPSQRDVLAAELRRFAGREAKVSLSVDESLIGGLVVRLGSRMIDTSIRSKLNRMLNAMKEVG